MVSWSFVPLLLLSATPLLAQTSYKNPVVASDFPDPSVIRVGKVYWSTATSSEWAPHFPILRSTDLVNWSVAGSVFSTRPAWAVANFWAPEIQEWKGKYYVYYVARQRGGPLSVAAATSDKPEGPYQDHGIIVAQEQGSIDPVAVDDENGRRYLIWKDDGNSRNLPTFLWAARLNADGTRIEGGQTPLFHNDSPWEGKVIEGPFLVRRDGWFYLFYSGAGCCGNGCDYALGVARSKKLLGPWEKHPGNPILAGNSEWRCPGHGSIVQDEKGRDWLLYHAYSAKGSTVTGRQGMLDLVNWETNGWPSINGSKGPSLTAPAPHATEQMNTRIAFQDEFAHRRLNEGWNWPLNETPKWRIEDGWLLLNGTGATNGSRMWLGRSIPAAAFTASTVLNTASLNTNAAAGIAAVGDGLHAAGLEWKSGKLMLWRTSGDQREITAETALPCASRLYLQCKNGSGPHAYSFAYSTDGSSWSEVTPTVSGKDMPPWDRAMRVAITVSGSTEATAAFDRFLIETAR